MGGRRRHVPHWRPISHTIEPWPLELVIWCNGQDFCFVTLIQFMPVVELKGFTKSKRSLLGWNLRVDSGLEGFIAALINLNFSRNILFTVEVDVTVFGITDLKGFFQACLIIFEADHQRSKSEKTESKLCKNVLLLPHMCSEESHFPLKPDLSELW